ncbi:MAG: hypothetical protein WCE21_05795 [Candidatus Babeliales bacterium]
MKRLFILFIIASIHSMPSQSMQFLVSCVRSQLTTQAFAQTSPQPPAAQKNDDYKTFCGIIDIAKLSAQGSDLRPEAAEKFNGQLLCKRLPASTSPDDIRLACTCNNQNIGTMGIGYTGVSSGILSISSPEPDAILSRWGGLQPAWGGDRFDSRDMWRYPFFAQIKGDRFKTNPFYVMMRGLKVTSVNGNVMPKTIFNENMTEQELVKMSRNCNYQQLEKEWMTLIDQYNKQFAATREQKK